jgi:hypothetical protein
MWDDIGITWQYCLDEAKRVGLHSIFIEPDRVPYGLRGEWGDYAHVADLFNGGKERLFEPLRLRQPRAHAALVGNAGPLRLLVTRDSDGQSCLPRPVVEVSGRVLSMNFLSKPGSYASWKTGVFSYIDPDLRDAYYWNVGRWNIPGQWPPFYIDGERMLPPGLGGWRTIGRDKTHYGIDARRLTDIAKVFRSISPNDITESWNRDDFHFFINNRPHGQITTEGDHLMVAKSDPQRRMFWIKKRKFPI